MLIRYMIERKKTSIEEIVLALYCRHLLCFV